jgi:NAD+ diphosphatase
MTIETVFSGGRIDRSAHLRGESAGRAALASARWALFWRGRLLCRTDGTRLQAAWIGADALSALPPLSAAPSVYLGETDGAPRFAADVTAFLPHLPEPSPRFADDRREELAPGLAFVELRAAMADLSHEDAGDAATARGVLEWHRTHPRCARCGAATEMQDGGWRRGCPDCGAQHFPRTDPVVIMLVLHGERALLGRQAIWPDRMYSLLAGYMEPGETVEEAVRRETMEEAGIPVGAVRYVCSQPWPFPSSLMIACVAEALDDRIRRTDAELEDALWAEKAEVAASLSGGPARFTAARRGAVARTLLEAWTEGRLPGP